jgi:enoyl-CoA hydratase/carnithine racemase
VEAPRLEQAGEGILTLTLNRPERRNAIDPPLRDALGQAIDRAALDPDVRALVITGAGGAFCAGGDLAVFDELRDARAYRRVSQRLTDLFTSLERLEKPVVAAIDGVVTGAGLALALALALACDWRTAAPTARILFREGTIGLVPTHGGLTRLVKLFGMARAKEILLGGEEWDAEAAHAVGLVSELAPSAAELPVLARRRVEKMLARAPLSFGAAKRLLALAADVDQQNAILAESLAQTALLQTEDHREGLAAVHDRREPVFKAS